MAKLLAHPVRVRLIAELAAGGPRSAARFTEQFDDLSLHDCAYHLGVLRRNHSLKRVKERQVRGARETTYRLRRDTRADDARALASFLDLFDGSNQTDDPNLVLPLTLDRCGVQDVRKALSSVHREISQIAAASRARMSSEAGSTELHAVLRLAVMA